MKTFFDGIPEGLSESARIDGASELAVFARIILPLSMPVLATIALFVGVGVWNDWFTGQFFIQNEKLQPAATFLNKMISEASFQSMTSSGNSGSAIQNMTQSQMELREKLNTIFASGTVPDIVNAPFWSATGGEGQVIKKAAMEGQLLDLTPYLDKYPNIKRLVTTGIAKDFAEFDLNSPDFEGKTYLIPTETPDGTPESIHNWNYGLFARGDILKALNVKAEDIDTQDELYDLLVKIRDGGFKDIGGKPVIPAGTMWNGWDYGQFLAGWSDYSISDFREVDGKLIHWTQSKDYEAKLLYMRKLLKEGLFDLEAFSNTSTTANEKLTTGKMAVFGAQPMLADLQKTLYKTNPEMQYELLGPMKNKNGDIRTQVEKPGRSGFPVLFLSANIKDPDAALRYIDYVNSEEGRLLAYFGIEGTHYTMENGIPQWIPDVKKQFDENPDLKRDAGLNFLPGRFIGAFSNEVTWPTPEDQKTQWQKLEESFSAKMPIKIIDKRCLRRQMKKL
ncbi:hypothetical protein BGX30_007548 [Mortierella sp. GBA39]|nr:hypothetical protein BGX30_007548 [Mortierella sp. GBA39]